MPQAKIKKIRIKVPQLTLNRAELFNIIEERIESGLRYGYMRAHKHYTPPENPTEQDYDALERRIVEEQLRDIMSKFYDLFAEDEPNVDDGR